MAAKENKQMLTPNQRNPIPQNKTKKQPQL